MKDSLQRRWRDLLDRAPDAPALGWYDRRRSTTWLTRADVAARSGAIAAGLVARGVEPGDPCVIVRPSELDTSLLVLGVHLAGAVPLLVAPPAILGENSNLGDVVTDVVRRTRARVVVAAHDVALGEDTVASTTTIVRDAVGDLGADTSELPHHLPPSDAIGGMQLTSGTTGFPRICVWRQRAMLAAIDGMGRAMALTTRDRCLNWTPLYHDMGLVNNLLTCVTLGVPLVMMSPHDFVRRPALWVQALSDTGATISWSPNFGFALAAERVRDADLDGVELGHVRALWNAAERIHLDTVLAFQARYAPFGLPAGAVRTNFGCAENIGGATFGDPFGPLEVERIDTHRLQEDREAILVTGDHGHATTVVGVGRPCPGMRVEIVDDDGSPLPDGHVGEIALDTPSALEGYLGDPEATARIRAGDLLRTGDLGYRRGDQLFWTGRARERITVRGKKLDPSDFEPVLLGVPGIRPGCFAAFGIDDASRGTERVVIVSEVREPLSEDDADLVDRIRQQVLGRLGVAVDEVLLVREGTLTKTSSGKRRHLHFRSMHADGRLEPYLVSRHA